MAAPEKRWHNSPTQALLPSDMFEMVTPSDANMLPFVTREIRVAVAGNLRVTRDGDQTPVTLAVLAGEKLPIQVWQVWATGTTATGILVYY